MPIARFVRAVGPLAVAGLIAAGLSGCSTGTFLDDADTLIGAESEAERERREQGQRVRQNKVPMQSVRRVEIGRTRDGYLITAFGTAPGLGYSLPELRPRRGGSPAADGFIEYDFVASEPVPDFQLPPGNTRTRAIRADLAVRRRDFQGARGVRVLTLGGGIQVPFELAAPSPAAEGTPDGTPEGTPDGAPAPAE